MRRSPEFEKALSMAVALLSVVAAGTSIFLIEQTPSVDFLNDRREVLMIALGAMAAVMSASVSLLMTAVLRRNRLRRRLRRVFIIYSQKDAQDAKYISDLLRKGEIEPWLDTEQIAAGEVWKDAISNAIDTSAMAIVLISENSASSEYVEFELRAAINKMEANDRVTSPIIPVVLKGGTLPSSLAHIQAVDMSRPDAEKFLLWSVERAMDKILSSSSYSAEARAD